MESFLQTTFAISGGREGRSIDYLSSTKNAERPAGVEEEGKKTDSD